jgi:hypothetical protein
MTGSDPSAAHASRRAPNRNSRPVRDSRPDRDCRPYRNANQPAPPANAHHHTDADAGRRQPLSGSYRYRLPDWDFAGQTGHRP